MKSERIEHLLAAAEKIESGHGGDPNAILAKYMDGREVLFTDVEVYWPSMVREMFRRGYVNRSWARRELRKYGLRLTPSPEEP